MFWSWNWNQIKFGTWRRSFCSWNESEHHLILQHRPPQGHSSYGRLQNNWLVMLFAKYFCKIYFGFFWKGGTEQQPSLPHSLRTFLSSILSKNEQIGGDLLLDTEKLAEKVRISGRQYFGTKVRLSWKCNEFGDKNIFANTIWYLCVIL